MKRIIFTLIITFFCANVWAQCPTGGIEIIGQASADSFGASNPDCPVIEGNLIFRANSSAVDVTTGFANIERINGDLWVRSVEVGGAFTNLDTIMGDIIVQDFNADGNSARLNASFPDLKYVGGNIRTSEFEGAAYNNASFPALERVEGGFSVCGDNLAVTNCGDCVSLEYIGGSVEGVVGGLNHVDTIIGSIHSGQCYNSPTSWNTSGYNELKYLGGDLIIEDSDGNDVDSITGFQQLTTIGGTFWCGNLGAGATDVEITGLGQLKHAGSIVIYFYDLTNLDFLSQLESVSNELRIVSSDRLTDISGLNHPLTIGGTLTIQSNPQLSACAVQAVCDHLNASGATLLGYNSTGCNSVAEIITICVPTADTIDGSIDTDFGTNGVIDIPGHDVAHILTQPDDKIIVFGNSILRLNPDGTLDTSFGTNGVASAGGFEGLLQPDGKIVVMSADQLARLNPDGTLDTTFGTGGTRSLIAPAKSIALSPDGKIVTSDTELTRYNADGSIDTTFGTNGKISGAIQAYHFGEEPGFPDVLKTYYPSYHVTVRSDGKIIAAGDFAYQTRYNPEFIIYYSQRMVHLAYNSDGTPDNSLYWLEGWGDESYNYVDDLLLSPDDELIRVSSGNYGIYGYLCMNVFDVSGSSVGGNCNYVTPPCNDDPYYGASWTKATVADCGIFAFGEYGTSGYTCQPLARFDFDGILNPDFGDNGGIALPVDASFYNTADIALQSDGSIIVAGNSATGIALARLHNDEACAVSLPIETLDPLQVYLKNNAALLTWRTATETNNEGFEMQRSKDGINWTRIGWQAGQGNALTPHSYTYTDENPLFGTSYYRFKQVDFNGDFTYSNVVTLQYNRPGVTIFPNPNTGIFDVQATTQGTYKILNTSGQIIQTGDLENNISIDISSYAQGIYFMSVQINDGMITKRIIKM